MVLAVNFASWWAKLIYVGGGILVLAGVAKLALGIARDTKRKLRPPPPVPPMVVFGHPSYSLSVEPLHERRLEQQRLLTKPKPSYLIENKDPSVTVADVTTGVRRKDHRREQTFSDFRAPAIAPGEKAPVTNVEVPPALFEGLTEEDYKGTLLFWARFSTDGTRRWEAVYDPETRNHQWHLLAAAK